MCCFFLQLIAARMIEIDVVSLDVVKWRISREEVLVESDDPDSEAELDGANSNDNNNEATQTRKLVDRYKINTAWCGVHVFANSYKKNYKHQFESINIDQ